MLSRGWQLFSLASIVSCVSYFTWKITLKKQFSVLSNSVFLTGKNMRKPLIKAVAKFKVHYNYNILKHFSFHYFCRCCFLQLQGEVCSTILWFVGEKDKLTQRIWHNTPGTKKLFFTCKNFTEIESVQSAPCFPCSPPDTDRFVWKRIKHFFLLIHIFFMHHSKYLCKEGNKIQ